MPLLAKAFGDIASVAKISRDKANELETDFLDNDGNYVIGLQFAQFLKPAEYQVITQNCDVSKMPIIPTKPIIRR